MLCLLVISMAAQAAKFLFWDRPQNEVIYQKAKIEASRAAAESLSLIGEVFSPDLNLFDGDISLPICPVVVKIQNDGQIPIQLKRLEFKVLVAQLRNVTIIEPIGALKGGPIVAPSGNMPNKPNETPHVGIIDYDSNSWTEVAGIVRKPSRDALPAGQSFTERLHVLSKRDSTPVLTKVEVSLQTEKHEYRWSGFMNPSMCGPVAALTEVSQVPSITAATEFSVDDPTSDGLINFIQREISRSVAVEIPKVISKSLDETAAKQTLETTREINAEMLKLIQQIRDTAKPPETKLATTTQYPRLDVDELVAKEITIVSRDGKTKVGRISSDPVSSYLVAGKDVSRPQSSLRFEIGQNSQNGGSIIVRNPRSPSNGDENDLSIARPIGIEIRAWKNEASVMLVDQFGQRVGGNGSLLRGSLVWNQEK